MDHVKKSLAVFFLLFATLPFITGAVTTIHYSRLRGSIIYPLTTDTNFSLTVASSNPKITFDSTDYWEFVRSTNRYDIYTGGAITESIINSGTQQGFFVGADGIAGLHNQVSDSNIRLTFASGDYFNFAPSTDILTYVLGSTTMITVNANGGLRQTGVAYASLGTPTNGTVIYCTDCTKATPCNSGGTGTLAKRYNGAWDCD
jgi:hypothetical protein